MIGLYCKVKLDKLDSDLSSDMSRNPTIIKLLEENSSLIENRHTGIPTMKTLMKEHDLPEPEFKATGSKFIATFRNVLNISETQNQVSGQVNNSSTINQYMEMVLDYCVVPHTLMEIKNYLNIKSRQYVSSKIVKPLVDSGKLDYYNKESIHFPKQKYIAIRRDKSI